MRFTRFAVRGTSKKVWIAACPFRSRIPASRPTTPPATSLISPPVTRPERAAARCPLNPLGSSWPFVSSHRPAAASPSITELTGDDYTEAQQEAWIAALDRQAARSAIVRPVERYAELTGNRKGSIITADDVIDGAAALVSVFVEQPQFQGLTEERRIVFTNFRGCLPENSWGFPDLLAE